MEKPLAIALGKLLITAAWADGELQKEEIDLIDRLIFRIPMLTDEDRQKLHLYMDHPVTQGEREAVLAEFVGLLNTPEDQKIAIDCLQRIIKADGRVDTTERVIFEEIMDAISRVKFGMVGKLSGFLKKTPSTVTVPMRERSLSDFVNNPIFFRFFRVVHAQQIPLDFSKDDLRKICLAGGLMAQVAHADNDLDPGEVEHMVEAMVRAWKLPENVARIAVSIAVSKEAGHLPIHRQAAMFLDLTRSDERVSFFSMLMELAEADGKVLPEEVTKLRAIGEELRLDRTDLSLKLKSLLMKKPEPAESEKGPEQERTE